MAQEAEVFERTWRRAVSVFEEALADPCYPDERRAGLYRALGPARELAEPDALVRLRAAEGGS